MRKLKAIYNIYKCRSFHLVTVTDSIAMKEIKIETNMEQQEFDDVMRDYVEGLVVLIKQRNQKNV